MKEDFVKYLNYIGITKKTHQKKIVSVCKKGVKVSQIKVSIEKLGYEEECIDKITSYLILPQYRKNIDKEINKAIKEEKGAWGLEK